MARGNWTEEWFERWIAGGWTDEEVTQARHAFAAADEDGDGLITAAEFRNLLGSLGHSNNESDAARVISELDRDGDLSLDLGEFFQFVDGALHGPDESQSYRDTFRILDSDGDGLITAAEFRLLMAEADDPDGERPSDEDVDGLFRGADVDGDGAITYEEFAKIMGR